MISSAVVREWLRLCGCDTAGPHGYTVSQLCSAQQGSINMMVVLIPGVVHD